jgi:ATPase subunit of ABC transporter with duplicated ATPase domains
LKTGPKVGPKTPQGKLGLLGSFRTYALRLYEPNFPCRFKPGAPGPACRSVRSAIRSGGDGGPTAFNAGALMARSSASVGATLVVKDLTLGHEPVVLAEGVSFVLAPGTKLGLVGPNGAGKTTLLRTLAGLVPASGAVSAMPRSATIGYLPQEVQSEAAPDETVREFLLRRTGVGPAEVTMDDWADRMGQGEDGADVTYSDALERWMALGGADFDARIATCSAEVGLTTAPSQPIASLSGGQAARVGLVSLLAARFDVFLLDEPTNNLDLEGLAILERFVKELRAPTAIVSHDRTFLENTVTDVLELDPIEKRSALFGGGFGAYLTEREVARRHAREAFDDYDSARSDLVDRARTVRNWTYAGAAKATKGKTDNDKIGAKKRAESTEKMASKARRLERQADRLDVVDEPRKVWQLQYEIASATRSGSLVCALTDAVVRHGSFSLGPVTIQISAGDRIAITGTNGSGKSTLLASLLGRLELSQGSRHGGSGVAIGELDQARHRFDNDQTLLDAVRAELPEQTLADIRTLLAKFGLGADDVHRSASTLSPGERTRAVLALFQARGVNCLVLDEPTNHLDLVAIEQLESALATYEGTLLLVTHDRRMLDAVSVNRQLRVENGVVTELSV